MALAPAPLNTAFTSSIVLVHQDQRVHQRRAGNDRRSVLIVVKHRNAHGAAQFLFDHETIRRLDVFQIDAAEGGLQHLAGANDILGVAGGQLQIENIDIGEAFEQHAFAFHHRLAG